jgi:hypothetical protein
MLNKESLIDTLGSSMQLNPINPNITGSINIIHFTILLILSPFDVFLYSIQISRNEFDIVVKILSMNCTS